MFYYKIKQMATSMSYESSDVLSQESLDKKSREENNSIVGPIRKWKRLAPMFYVQHNKHISSDSHKA
jgi:hypothetical protein